MAKSVEKAEKKKHKSKSKDKLGKLKVKKTDTEHKVKEKHSKSKDKKIAKEHKSKLKSKSDSESESKSKKKSKSKSKSKSSKHEEPKLEDPVTTTTARADSESDSELDREELRQLLGSYSKEQLVDLICTTAEKGSKLISAIDDGAGDDVSLRNIFVHGFGWDTTRESLTAFFESYGEIEYCNVVMDKSTGRAKGFGFVLFKTRKAAKKALKIPQKKMFNRTVSCNLASKRPGKEKEAIAEPVKIGLSQGQQISLGQGHQISVGQGHQISPSQGQQQSQAPAMTGQNLAFYGQHMGIDPAFYSGMMGNPLLAGALNYGVMGSGFPTSHAGPVAGFGYGGGDDRAWYLR